MTRTLRGKTATNNMGKEIETLNHTDAEKEKLPAAGIDRGLESIDLAVLRFPFQFSVTMGHSTA